MGVLGQLITCSVKRSMFNHMIININNKNWW